MMFYDSDILDMDEDMKDYWLNDDIQNCSKILINNRTEIKQKIKLYNRNMHIINESKKDGNKSFTPKYYNRKSYNINNKIKRNNSTTISRKTSKDKKLNYI